MSTGYDPLFLTKKINLPKLSAIQKKFLAPLIINPQVFEIQHTHFSVMMNKVRKFAFFAATNIDGSQWKALVKERIKFSKDKSILPEFQTGIELYDLYKNVSQPDFDQGHIAKFQDPQWGDIPVAAQAAADTMTYTNCLPQHHTLNRGAWKCLEDYIVKEFTTSNGADGSKISVFAGPVLSDTDPFYIQKIQGQPFKIPCLFWKVIVYRNKAGRLSTVAFMMSQHNILRKYNFVTDYINDIHFDVAIETVPPDTDYFKHFTSGEPYQVSIVFVEQITGLKFSLQALYQPYMQQEPNEIIFKRIEVPLSELATRTAATRLQAPVDFIFQGIKL